MRLVGWDLVGFLTAFSGTYLIAVTGNFGFLAPVLAKESPSVLDSINQYTPVVAINGLAAITFMVGFALFGIAMIRTASLPRMSGILVAVGGPAHLLGFGIAQFISPIFWVIAILGSLSLGAGLGRPGIGCGAHRLLRMSLFQISRHVYEHRSRMVPRAQVAIIRPALTPTARRDLLGPDLWRFTQRPLCHGVDATSAAPFAAADPEASAVDLEARRPGLVESSLAKPDLH